MVAKTTTSFRAELLGAIGLRPVGFSIPGGGFATLGDQGDKAGGPAAARSLLSAARCSPV